MNLVFGIITHVVIYRMCTWDAPCQQVTLNLFVYYVTFVKCNTNINLALIMGNDPDHPGPPPKQKYVTHYSYKASFFKYYPVPILKARTSKHSTKLLWEPPKCKKGFIEESYRFLVVVNYMEAKVESMLLLC